MSLCKEINLNLCKDMYIDLCYYEFIGLHTYVKCGFLLVKIAFAFF